MSISIFIFPLFIYIFISFSRHSFVALISVYGAQKDFFLCRFCTNANFICVFVRINASFWQKCVCEYIRARTTSQIDFLA